MQEYEKPFKNKNMLIKHLNEVHPKEVQCGMWNGSFPRNCDLEVHTEEQHKAPKKFKCNTCKVMFFLNWRLKKHETLHTKQITRRDNPLQI